MCVNTDGVGALMENNGRPTGISVNFWEDKDHETLWIERT